MTNPGFTNPNTGSGGGEGGGGALGALVAAGAIASNLYTQKKNRDHNAWIAQTQIDANERYQNQQNFYNSPAEQMKRFKEAGLNPHLIYGQGNPGNQSSPLTHPGINPTDFTLPSIIPLINQTLMTKSQVQANNAKTQKTYAETAVTKLQEQVVARNPLLNDAGFKAIIDSLKATAVNKELESGMRASQLQVQETSAGHQVSKIFKQIELLDQQFRLGQADEKLKGEIIKSQQFKNAMLEVQKSFLADGEIGAQQVYQFLQLFLLKLM